MLVYIYIYIYVHIYIYIYLYTYIYMYIQRERERERERERKRKCHSYVCRTLDLGIVLGWGGGFGRFRACGFKAVVLQALGGFRV